MTVVYLSPIGNGFNFATEGWLPLDSGKLYTYLAGTETPQATWTTADGDVENANPIILGVDGRPPSEIWLETGVAYLFVLTDSDDNPIQSYDDLTGINDVAAATASIAVQDEGIAQGNASTFNFVGGSVSAGVSGSVATITVTSASGTLASGDIVASAARTRSGALICDGSAVSRSTYSALFAAIVPSLGTFTVTIATPAVFTLASHGLVAGDSVYFTTTGALPTGLTANTLYYVIATGLTSGAFEISATEGGSAVNTTGSQSGVHTARFCPYGLGNGTTTFNVPFISGRAPIGAGTGSGLTARALGRNGGVEDVTLTGAQSGTSAHTHTASTSGSLTLNDVSITNDTVGDFYIDARNGSGASQMDIVAAGGVSGLTTTVNASSAAAAGSSHTNMQPFIVLNYFIITG
jgi:microcystin-dependent protein